MNKEWEERNCRNCKIQLGCPHSTLAQCFMIEPTDGMKPIILEKICAKHKMEEK